MPAHGRFPQQPDSRLVWFGHASLRSISLRQREWNRADGDKQKQIKSASNKMRFDGGLICFSFVLFSLEFRFLEFIFRNRDTVCSQVRQAKSILFLRNF